MEENESKPWELPEGYPDATVEDICDFIVEYINSDVMVCLFLVFIALSSIHSTMYRVSWRTVIS